MCESRPTRDERGLAMPSPVIVLSIVAIALAVVAYFLTGTEPKEREITPAAAPESSAAPSQPADKPAPPVKKKPKKKPIQRGEIPVEVYNNTNITGLAGSVGDKASTVGWNVVGVDDWRGTVPANTVYFPPRLEAAGKQLALDLGIKRTHVAAEDSMDLDRLTVVLVAPLP